MNGPISRADAPDASLAAQCEPRVSFSNIPQITAEVPLEVSAILFEMADVLYDGTVWRRWLLQLLSHLGLHTQYDAFYRVWERQHFYHICRGRREFWQSLREFLGEAGLSAGQIGEVIAAARPRRTQLLRQARPFPGVAATLARLAASGLQLAVLENSDLTALDLRRRLDEMGLGQYFSVVLSSYDLKHAKPDKTCYLSAIAELKVPAHEIALISHDPIDLRGARQLGLGAIATNHGPEVEADVCLSRFADLSHAVCRREPRRLAG